MKPGRHGKALENTLANQRTPKCDHDTLKNALFWYRGWVERMDDFILQLKQCELTSENYICEMVNNLNQYKMLIDMELIYDSQENFLYRNKGQLKLCSTIMEEFLERFIPPLFPGLSDDLEMGSMRCVSSIQLDLFNADTVVTVDKDQDFAVSRKVYMKVGTSPDEDAKPIVVRVPLVAIECKTYIDKTMFQESVATSNRMKSLCPHSRYFILSEWLGMQPVDTSHTGIDRVFVARKAKRFRDRFKNSSLHTYEGRKEKRQEFLTLTKENSLDWKVFMMLVEDMKPALTNYVQDTAEVLARGYF